MEASLLKTGKRTFANIADNAAGDGISLDPDAILAIWDPGCRLDEVSRSLHEDFQRAGSRVSVQQPGPVD